MTASGLFLQNPGEHRPGGGGGVVVAGGGVVVVGWWGPYLGVVRVVAGDGRAEPTANASGAAERDALPAAPPLAAGG